LALYKPWVSDVCQECWQLSNEIITTSLVNGPETVNDRTNLTCMEVAIKEKRFFTALHVCKVEIQRLSRDCLKKRHNLLLEKRKNKTMLTKAFLAAYNRVAGSRRRSQDSQIGNKIVGHIAPQIGEQLRAHYARQNPLSQELFSLFS
jgi:hypothetical protein